MEEFRLDVFLSPYPVLYRAVAMNETSFVGLKNLCTY